MLWTEPESYQILFDRLPDRKSTSVYSFLVVDYDCLKRKGGVARFTGPSRFC